MENKKTNKNTRLIIIDLSPPILSPSHLPFSSEWVGPSLLLRPDKSAQ